MLAIGLWLATSPFGRIVGMIGAGLLAVFGAYGWGRMKQSQADSLAAARAVAANKDIRSKVDEKASTMSGSAIRDGLRGDARG